MPELRARLQEGLAGTYTIDRELGRGGMATVFLAHDLKHDRDVALKVLQPELAAVLGRERFLAEIRFTARLDHPHILTLLDSGESDSFVWYTRARAGYTRRTSLTPPPPRSIEGGGLASPFGQDPGARPPRAAPGWTRRHLHDRAPARAWRDGHGLPGP